MAVFAEDFHMPPREMRRLSIAEFGSFADLIDRRRAEAEAKARSGKG